MTMRNDLSKIKAIEDSKVRADRLGEFLEEGKDILVEARMARDQIIIDLESGKILVNGRRLSQREIAEYVKMSPSTIKVIIWGNRRAQGLI